MDKSHDDALKTNRNNPAQPSASAQSSKTHPQNLQSQSSQPQDQQSQFISHTPTQNNPAVAFKSDYIGQWAAKQEDPFAEQNRKAAEKKAAQEAARKKVMPYIKIGSIVAACVAVLAVIIVVIIGVVRDPDADYTPEIAGSSEEDIIEYRDLLQQFYNRKKGEQSSDEDLVNPPNMGEAPSNSSQEDKNLINSVNQVVQNTLETFNGQDHANAVLCAQAYFYYNNGYYQEVVDTIRQINIDSLNNSIKSNIYEVAANSYYWLGDEEAADTYYDLLLAMPVEN